MSASADARQLRADAQRNRILCAAQKCFAERGFHAASMASIAETADMSPGLIYRYFAGKSEIIQGIVRRQLDLFAAQLLRPDGLRSDLATTLHDSFYGRAKKPDEALEMRAALILEISAEASRDAGIAAALREFDALINSALREWIAGQRAPTQAPLSEDALAARALALRCFIEGLKVRQTREPNLDEELLRRALRDLLAHLRS